MPWGRLPTHDREPQGEYIAEPGNESLGGGGNFNTGIYVVKRQQDGRKCVEKRFKPADILSGAATFEIALLRELSNKHITEYLDSFVHKSGGNPRASVYMEYCDLGTLADTLQARKAANNPAKEWGVWELFIQLTNAVVYCQRGIHDAVMEPKGTRDMPWIGIVHRDIKPANIFLRTNYRSSFPHVVLGDFGQAIRCDRRGNWNRPFMGNDRSWAPPEAPNFNYSSDTWSIGCVVQGMCRLETTPQRKFLGAGEGYSKTLDRAIHTLIRPDPLDRPHLAKFAAGLDKMRHEAPDGVGLRKTRGQGSSHQNEEVENSRDQKCSHENDEGENSQGQGIAPQNDEMDDFLAITKRFFSEVLVLLF